ncbi:hypothetical protein PTKIN_Ptkin19aG0107300 [Pterospermum kingtungense]
MEGCSDINPMKKEWLKVSEEKKLELRLGPPGELFLAYNSNNLTHGTKKRALQHTAEPDRKTCASLATADADFTTNTDSTSNKRWLYPLKLFLWFVSSTNRCNEPFFFFGNFICYLNGFKTSRIACSPVVGWPPVRSSRRNLASNSMFKPASESPNVKEDNTGENPESSKPQMFIKVNMEGVPIGRKVNLSAYNSYEQLSLAIHELFSGLLAAQRDSFATQIGKKIEELVKADGSGDYTLIYEDDEGDRVLAGDVPWHMFVSTAKRLHVLKSSELSTLQIGNNEKEKGTT